MLLICAINYRYEIHYYLHFVEYWRLVYCVYNFHYYFVIVDLYYMLFCDWTSAKGTTLTYFHYLLLSYHLKDWHCREE